MRLNIIYLAFVLFSLSACSQEVLITDLVEKEGLVYYKNSTEPFTGKAFLYRQNGEKSMESEYINGVSNGIEIIWNNNEKMFMLSTIKDGKLNGEWKEFYPDGTLKSLVHYKDDYMYGHCERYYENGQKMEEGEYEHCKETGMWIYWYENGNKKEEGSYEDAKKVGLWKYWDIDGNILIKDSEN